MSTERSCTKCGGPYLAKGLCKKCYYRQPDRILAGLLWARSEAGKASHKKSHDILRSQYVKSDGYKKAQSKYRKSDKRKLCQKRYSISIKGRISGKSRSLTRRLRELNTCGEITKEIIQRIYEDNIKKFGTLTCILCYYSIIIGEDSLEHLTPICRGGTNLYENLGVSHLKCNKIKGKRTMEELLIAT